MTMSSTWTPNWANVTDPRSTLNYEFFADAVDIMTEKTIIFGNGSLLNQQPVTFSLVAGNGSTHNHLFSLDANGSLKTLAPLDHEANATLSIRVRATDDYNATLEKVLAINVTNANDAPTFTLNGGEATASVNAYENQTLVVDLNATDGDGDTLTYSIGGGADQAKFSIVSATGVLTFNSSDYENPTDADGNNTYEVVVTVTDSGNLSAVKPVTIRVTDVNEGPTAIGLAGVVAGLAEDSDTAGATKIGDVMIADPDDPVANAMVIYRNTANGKEYLKLSPTTFVDNANAIPGYFITKTSVIEDGAAIFVIKRKANEQVYYFFTKGIYNSTGPQWDHTHVVGSHGERNILRFFLGYLLADNENYLNGFPESNLTFFNSTLVDEGSGANGSNFSLKNPSAALFNKPLGLLGLDRLVCPTRSLPQTPRGERQ